MFWFFSHKACRRGIEPVSPVLEGEVSTTGRPEKPPHITICNKKQWIKRQAAAAAAKSRQSCPTLCDRIDGSPPGLLCPWDSPGKNTGVACHCFLHHGCHSILFNEYTMIYLISPLLLAFKFAVVAISMPL